MVTSDTVQRPPRPQPKSSARPMVTRFDGCSATAVCRSASAHGQPSRSVSAAVDAVRRRVIGDLDRCAMSPSLGVTASIAGVA